MAELLSAEEYILIDAPKSGKLAQSYIIHAPNAKSAEAAAYAFARRIMCEDHTGCKKCGGCLKFDGMNHLDVYIIDTDASVIKKDDVEPIPAFLAEKAYEGGYKVVLIKEADRMNPSAQNLLLKSVEETPENVVFIFSTANLSGLLRTIRSRSIDIYIKPRPRKEIEKAFADEGELAGVYAAFSGGSIEEAQRLKEDEHFIADRNEVMNMIEILYTYRNPRVYKLAAMLEPDIVSRTVYAATVFTDAIKLSFGADKSRITNVDMYDKILTLSNRFTEAGMSIMTDIMLEANEKKNSCPGLSSRMLAQDIIIKLLEVRSRCLKL